MNEQIRLLAEQMHITVLTTKGMENISDGCYIVSPDKLQEFAELLIRECVTKMALEIMDKQWVDDAVKNTYDYFGVKE